MNVAPCLPDNAPFSAEQRAWMNGFLAGLFSSAQIKAPERAPQDGSRDPRSPLLIGFGSQTGSAQGLARRLAQQAETHGFAPSVKELNTLTVAELGRTERCVIVTSTWGEGDPPDNAAEFWKALRTAANVRLDRLQFAVLGLGDRNYPEFCGAAKKFDERLQELGASRVVPRAECDVDYESDARTWMTSLWTALTPATSASQTIAPPLNGAASAVPVEAVTPHDNPSVASAAKYSRAHPFPARLKSQRRLNRIGSAKDTRHYEIDLTGSDLRYEAGDALGVVPRNNPALVEALLANLGFTGDESLPSSTGAPTSLHESLSSRYVITSPTPRLIQDVAKRSDQTALLGLLQPANKADLERWLVGRDVLDVLQEGRGIKYSPEEWIALLAPLQPRLYSISSSPKAHPNEVHLTVATVRYEAHGRARQGVCSGWLADRVRPQETPVPVFVQSSAGFRLPSDTTRPVIMIGPGTGIAPFRAFLQERRAVGASGKNWLFFGDQQRAVDFLYEEELLDWTRDGLLHRLDLAFSRDQAEKIYVQDRMREHQAELWAWLENGAHFYVCGDAKRMAKDVDAALREVIAIAGGRTPDQAAEYVAALKTAKRYQRDVY